MSRSNVMIVQGGGPTAVFNASLAAVIAGAQAVKQFGSLYGARFGVGGLVSGDLLDLTGTTPAQLERLRNTPGAALGSSRHSPTEAEMGSLLDVLDELKIGALIFMGGNGTMRGANIVSDHCRTRGLDVAVVGVPKTVDNDLASTDRCPGYASAARYAALSTLELAADVRSLRQPVTILETLGRNVGWVAAATALARGDAHEELQAPHVVCVPEVAFDEDAFLEQIDDVVTRIGWAVAVVGEGIRFADGSLVYQTTASGQADPLKRPLTGGVARHLATRVSERLGIRCRSEIPGLLGRASMRHVATRDTEDAYAVGHAGVAALRDGMRDVMVSLQPLRGDRSQTSLIPLAKAGGEERTIPSEWLRDGPLPVNNAFMNYVRPLVGELDQHITELGTPLSLERHATK